MRNQGGCRPPQPNQTQRPVQHMHGAFCVAHTAPRSRGQRQHRQRRGRPNRPESFPDRALRGPPARRVPPRTIPWLFTGKRRAGRDYRPKMSRTRFQRMPRSSTAFRSAWTARVPGGTTSSSNGSGDRSNTRRSIRRPTTACRKQDLRSRNTSPSPIPDARTRALTGARPTRPISAVGSRQSAVGSRQSAVGSRQSAVGRWQPAAGRWPWPPERRPRFCRRSGRATPSRRRDEIAKPRIRHPAGGPLRFRAALSDQAGPPLFCVAHTAPRIRGYRHEPRWVCRRL
jgi:hypothetical protein